MDPRALAHPAVLRAARAHAAIDELLIGLNERSFQRLDGSRSNELDRPALKAPPLRAYEYAQWKLAKVHSDYHIEVDHAYYSVPYKHVGERVEVRLSAGMIEIFAKRQLIASHVRLFKHDARATWDAHRPANHRAIVDTTIERLLQRAEAIAPSVAEVLREQFNRKRHPEEALRVAQGILRLAQDFSCAHRPMTDTIPERWRTAFRWHGGQCSGAMPDSLGL